MSKNFTPADPLTAATRMVAVPCADRRPRPIEVPPRAGQTPGARVHLGVAGNVTPPA